MEIAKFVHALVSAATIADLHGSAFRQPNGELVFVELDRGIRNVEMLSLQPNLRERSDQIGIQTQDLVIINRDPDWKSIILGNIH